MKQVVTVLFAMAVICAAPQRAAAKSPTIQIEIRGLGLATPIELTDPAAIGQFYIWAGPGTSSNQKQSLIVDWSRGTTGSPPAGLPRY